MWARKHKKISRWTNYQYINFFIVYTSQVLLFSPERKFDLPKILVMWGDFKLIIGQLNPTLQVDSVKLDSVPTDVIDVCPI